MRAACLLGPEMLQSLADFIDFAARINPRDFLSPFVPIKAACV
jgi:hypothetical protein